MSLGLNPPRARTRSVGRGAVIGAAIGCALVVMFVATIGVVNRVGIVPAFGLGVFAGLWGGLGLGGMLGATLQVMRREEGESVPEVDSLAEGSVDGRARAA